MCLPFGSADTNYVTARSRWREIPMRWRYICPCNARKDTDTLCIWHKDSFILTYNGRYVTPEDRKEQPYYNLAHQGESNL